VCVVVVGILVDRRAILYCYLMEEEEEEEEFLWR
jgi:hypothetical protein